MLIQCPRTEPCRDKAQEGTIIPSLSPELLAIQKLHKYQTLLGKMLLRTQCGEKNHARNSLKLKELCLVVLFFLSGKGRQGEKTQQNKAEFLKSWKKPPIIFMPRRKLGCFSKLWLILDSLSRPSRMAWQVGLWPLATSRTIRCMMVALVQWRPGTSCHMFPGWHLHLCPACLTWCIYPAQVLPQRSYLWLETFAQWEQSWWGHHGRAGLMCWRPSMPVPPW